MKKYLLIILIFFALTSCKEEASPNYKEIIQGKWHLVEIGNGDNLVEADPWMIYEYSDPDKFTIFDPVKGVYLSNRTYKFENNELLLCLQNEQDNCYRYQFEFSDDYQELELVFLSFPKTNRTNVFKRIDNE
jgi:hypothetical protein